MKQFAEVKGYATVENAKKAAVKKGLDLDVLRYCEVVVANGRYSLAFTFNQPEWAKHRGVDFAHMGFCVIG